MKKLICICISFFSLYLYGMNGVGAASVMEPNFEVKLLLKPEQVINDKGKLNKSVLEYFQASSSSEKINVQFLDTNEKDLYDAGWTARIRKKESEQDFELTYKKRYPIQNDDIQEALVLAKKVGFDQKSNNYEAQIDWGFEKKTLSISNKKSHQAKGYGLLQLPGEKEARKMMIDKLPDKMNNWLYKNWAKNILNQSHIFGPVLVDRYQGKYNKLNTDIEVWPLDHTGNKEEDYIVEVSFKVNDEKTARKQRELFIQALQKQGWLLPKDSLKTELILKGKSM
ncbi:hypothetical protein SAMN04488168_10819 [Bacillus sp. 491mf]|nr:hypothetical protein SAMN04488168_10819 [Bacillus sp. 491mf]